MSAFGDIRIDALDVKSQDALEAVIELGDVNRDTLGQLPYAVFTEAASQSRLLVATQGHSGKLLGYALYRLPRNEISLTHLCVDDDCRGRGVANSLVDEVSRRHDDRLGIRAKCRDDYQLDDAWVALGFRPRSQTTGRGRDQAPMTVWWKDHGHPDLFSAFEQPVELRAAIDLNVIRDLAKPEARNGRSDLLTADHLADRLQLVITTGTHAEITRQEGAVRRDLMKAVDPFPLINTDEAEVDALRAGILSELRDSSPSYPETPQDHADLTQVVHAAAAGLSVFLTWDNPLVQTLGDATARVTGMKIIPPDYVVVHLDELANAEAFLEESLAGSALTQARIGTDVSTMLDTFLARPKGERRKEFRNRVSELIRNGHRIEVVRTDDGDAVALYCTEVGDDTLVVSLLRLAEHRLSDTIARHLIWMFRQQARKAGVSGIAITEPHLSRSAVQGASFEPMMELNDNLYAPVIDACGSAHLVAEAASGVFERAQLPPAPLFARGMPAQAAAALERAWWPAKVLDSELPCFIVPIKSSYAYELFGYPAGLTSRDTQLSLGREHVYYHSKRNSPLDAPARILWLATGDGPGAGHIFGASQLDGLDVDTPENLHAALSYYGVFNLDAVISAASGNPTAEALRVSNTEIFDRPVSLRRYRALRSSVMSGPTDFQCPRRLTSSLYGAVYKEGTSSPRSDKAEI